MRHHAFAAATGLLAALLLPGAASHAAAADPTGYWKKPDAEREAKIQVSRCGRGLCAKIVWLKDPKDSRGRPLQDVRNANPAQRGRTIVGLPLFTGFAPSGPNAWAGKIYNPEDGNTYSATLTMVSSKQIVLKGCKAWLLCGEKIWLRTSAPPAPEPEPEEQIEASAQPEAAPATAAAEAKPAAKPVEAAAAPAPSLAEETQQAGAEPQPQAPVAQPIALMTPVSAPAEHGVAADGYQFLNTSAAPIETLSGEDVSSMLVMTKPIATEPAAAPSEAAAAPTKAAALPADTVPDEAPAAAATKQAAVQEANPAAAAKKPAVQHKPAPMQATAAANPKPAAGEAPAPQDEAAQQSAEATEAIQAGTVTEPVPLTRRERRLLRRKMNQQQPLLPWLQ
jgi:uncharacterized protein (DUF2147 family)